MNLIKIFRIEDESGTGPYQCMATWADEMRWAHRDMEHPGGMFDFLDRPDDHECYYGFDSAEAAVIWFDQWLPVLEKHDYMMTEWLVPEDQVEHGQSGRQVRFKAREFKPVAVYKPTEIYIRY